MRCGQSFKLFTPSRPRILQRVGCTSRTIRYTDLLLSEERVMPARKKSKTKPNGRSRRRHWSKADHRELKEHSKNRTPVARISRSMKRTVGALRQQALKLGLGLGHRR